MTTLQDATDVLVKMFQDKVADLDIMKTADRLWQEIPRAERPGHIVFVEDARIIAELIAAVDKAEIP